jgi:hypothetical protein
MAPGRKHTLAVNMAFKNIKVSTDGEDRVHIITLNRPPENRLDSTTCQEIIQALRAIVGLWISEKYPLTIEL